MTRLTASRILSVAVEDDGGADSDAYADGNGDRLARSRSTMLPDRRDGSSFRVAHVINHRTLHRRHNPAAINLDN